MDTNEWLRVAWYAFFVFALLASPLWSVFASWRRRRARAGEPVVEARVLAATLESGAGGYRPRWDVEYEHRGERHRARCHEADDRFVTGTTRSPASAVRAAAQRRLDRHAVGDIVQVRLRPGRPQDVCLAREELDLAALYLVLGMVGVVAVCMGLLYAFF